MTRQSCMITTTISILLLAVPTVSCFSLGPSATMRWTTISTRHLLSAASDDYEKLDGEQRINLKIDLDSPKVATMDDIGIGEKKKVYCRCWLSGTFPMCDGTHMKHNAAMNDNVGPLIVSSAPPNAKEESKKVVADTKVEGRKKRLLFGYYATSIAYLVYAARYFSVKGVQPFAVQVASGYTLAAGLAYILASAVKGNRLSSDTYKRLNLSILEFGLVGALGWGLVKFGDVTPGFAPLLLAPFLAVVNGIKGYGYGVLGVDKAGNASLLGDFKQGVISTVKGYFAMPKNIKAAGYLAATWFLTGMKLAKLVEIGRLVADGANGLTIYTRLSRFARYAMMSTVLYTLKDAADRGRLEGTTFIELNVLSSGVLAALASYAGVTKTPIGGAAAVFSVFSAFNGATSILKKRQS